VEALAPSDAELAVVDDVDANALEERDETSWLIDNAAAYENVNRAIECARTSIWIAQLALDSDCSVRRGTSDTLLDTILDAVVTRGLDVRVLLNASLLLNTTKPLARFLRQSGSLSPRLQIRGVSAFPQLLHAKLVIVDGAHAFMMGSPFVNDYWDDEGHLPTDASRPKRELGGRPLHDVSMSLTGPAVSDLKAIFTELWNYSAEKGSAPRPKPAWGGVGRNDNRVQILSTFPKKSSGPRVEGATEILDSLTREIRAARRLIYIEHQYLSSRRIVAELAGVIERQRELEMVVVLNQNPDITAYQGWQNKRLAESGLLNHPRVGVFSLWSSSCGGECGVSLNQIFVHSKIVTIDDRVAIVGSANLDGVSLHSYGDDFSGLIARRTFRDVRNFDVSALVRDDSDDNSPGSVADLRMRLWSEHLGLPQDEIRRATMEEGLATWRKTAELNVETLRTRASDRLTRAPMKGHVLPYSSESVPKQQLASLGIDVRPAGVNLEYNPGWLEVRFSPNWIRNMFL
jgi:phosphatidylserine/phosphatidylglycerophosphate/cardiolipin synthase-like enzyme